MQDVFPTASASDLLTARNPDARLCTGFVGVSHDVISTMLGLKRTFVA
jgi:hypothetical protein